MGGTAPGANPFGGLGGLGGLGGGMGGMGGKNPRSCDVTLSDFFCTKSAFYSSFPHQLPFIFLTVYTVGMDPAAMAQMMNNPMMQQAMQQMMSNPAMLDQMAAMDPQMGKHIANS